MNLNLTQVLSNKSNRRSSLSFRNVYFTDSVRKHVAVCSLDHSGCTVLVSGIEQPRAIAIHHNSKQVLYTDWGTNSAIVQLSLDGSNKKNLIDEEVSWPNGLAVDQVLDRIYWSDAKKDTIESILGISVKSYNDWARKSCV